MSRGKLVLRDIEERKDFFDDCLSMAVLTFNHLLDHFSVLFPTRFIVVLASLVLAMFAKIAGPLPGLGTDELQQLQEIRLVKQSFQVLLDIDKFSRFDALHMRDLVPIKCLDLWHHLDDFQSIVGLFSEGIAK